LEIDKKLDKIEIALGIIRIAEEEKKETLMEINKII
jgi:hypothetical protein